MITIYSQNAKCKSEQLINIITIPKKSNQFHYHVVVFSHDCIFNYFGNDFYFVITIWRKQEGWPWNSLHRSIERSTWVEDLDRNYAEWVIQNEYLKFGLFYVNMIKELYGYMVSSPKEENIEKIHL